MMLRTPPLSPRELFATNLPLIDALIGGISRRHRMSAQDAEDFASIARLRLLEHDCKILRRFEGRSSLSTFLNVVFERIYLDYRASAWGKWRASAAARRLGPLAVQLERLIRRDAMSFEEACETLRITRQGPLDLDALRALFDALPSRPRRRQVDVAVLENLPAAEDDALASVHNGDLRQTIAALRRAMARLTTRDRRIIGMKFVNQLTIAEIARRGGLDQKALYRHFQQILRRLRLELEMSQT
jgi:RNA polymerase sigma factor (sigma-70 family)